MRATAEVEELTRQLGAAAILDVAGSALSSQAVGPKLLWLQRHEPEIWARTARSFSASSFLVHRLTGEYLLDHHTASQCDPMDDIRAQDWTTDWAAALTSGVARPTPTWSSATPGTVTTHPPSTPPPPPPPPPLS